MPPDNDLELPPRYPDGWLTHAGVYKALGDLHGWVAANRDRVNEDVNQPVVPPLRPLPARTVFDGLAVRVVLSHLDTAAAVYDAWYHLLKEYQHCWGDLTARVARARLFAQAALFLNDTGLANEHREARLQADAQAARSARAGRIVLVMLRDANGGAGGPSTQGNADFFDAG